MEKDVFITSNRNTMLLNTNSIRILKKIPRTFKSGSESLCNSLHCFQGGIWGREESGKSSHQRELLGLRVHAQPPCPTTVGPISLQPQTSWLCAVRCDEKKY